jgi:hypothetical protein
MGLGWKSAARSACDIARLEASLGLMELGTTTTARMAAAALARITGTFMTPFATQTEGRYGVLAEFSARFNSARLFWTALNRFPSPEARVNRV